MEIKVADGFLYHILSGNRKNIEVENIKAGQYGIKEKDNAQYFPPPFFHSLGV